MVIKADLAKKIRDATGLSYEASSRCLNIFIESVAGALAGGETIELRGLGTFTVSPVAQRKMALQKDGPAVIPAHGRIAFRPAQKLRQAAWDSGVKK